MAQLRRCRRKLGLKYTLEYYISFSISIRNINSITGSFTRTELWAVRVMFKHLLYYFDSSFPISGFNLSLLPRDID